MKQKLYKHFAFIFCIFITISSRVYSIDNYLSEEKDYLKMAEQLAIYLLAFIFIVLLTFYGTKFIAKYSKKLGHGNSIHVLEQFSLGAKNKIVVMKIYDKEYILAINNDKTTVIDKLETRNRQNQENDKSLNENRDFEKHLDIVMDAIENKSDDSGINNKLINMKMKVLKLKNDKYKELLDKEEDYE